MIIKKQTIKNDFIKNTLVENKDDSPHFVGEAPTRGGMSLKQLDFVKNGFKTQDIEKLRKNKSIYESVASNCHVRIAYESHEINGDCNPC